METTIEYQIPKKEKFNGPDMPQIDLDSDGYLMLWQPDEKVHYPHTVLARRLTITEMKGLRKALKRIIRRYPSDYEHCD